MSLPELGSLSDRLRELELGVARLTVKIEVLVAELGPERADFENRLRALEARVQTAVGMAIAGGTLLGAVSGLIVDTLLHR